MNGESSEGGRGAQIPEWPPVAIIFNPCTIAGKRALSQLCRRGAWGKRKWRDQPASQTCSQVGFRSRGSWLWLGLLWARRRLESLEQVHATRCRVAHPSEPARNLVEPPVYLVTILVSTDQWSHFVSFHGVGNMIRCRWGGCLPCRGNGCLCPQRERCRMGT